MQIKERMDSAILWKKAVVSMLRKKERPLIAAMLTVK